MTTALARHRVARPSLRSSAAAHHRSTARRQPAARAVATSWEIRTFIGVVAFIALVVLLAILYVGQTTAVSRGGYDVQRLTEQRDELRRQSSLLEVRIAKLDSPTRIESDAKSLGLVRARSVPIVAAEALAAVR